MTRKLKPVSPGEMLAEEFLKPLSMSNYRLAKEIGVPAQRIGEIVAGKRAITADTDLRLCRFFGLSDGWWLRVRADYDKGPGPDRVGPPACRQYRHGLSVAGGLWSQPDLGGTACGPGTDHRRFEQHMAAFRIAVAHGDLQFTVGVHRVAPALAPAAHEVRQGPSFPARCPGLQA